MANGTYIAYYRVSTQKQGKSGLGLEAQQSAVRSYLNGGNWNLVAEVVEVESGKRSDRPKLAEALRLCRLHDATLVIAKLDRLARDAHFLLGLQKAGVRFVAADMPEANEMVVGIMAVVAQAERKMISDRTKAALRQAKERGVKLGGNRGFVPPPGDASAARKALTDRANAKASDLAPVIKEIREAGVTSLGGIARALNERGIPTARGKGEWSAVQVQRVLERVAA